MKDESKNEWTVMIYLAGDNNLSQDMISAIIGIEKATRKARRDRTYTTDVAFAIEFDCAHPVAKTRRYIITKDKKINASTLGAQRPGEIIHEEKGQTVVEMREQSSTSEAIKSLVRWCIEHQPAHNYALILSGHSDAFQGRTLLLDENQDEAMKLKKLRETLTELKGLLPKKKFDILAFDGCVMNSFEVIYEMKDLAEIWIGSQGSIPNYTWDYQSIAKRLVACRLGAEKIGRLIVRTTRKYNKKYAFGGRSVDISYCKINEAKIQNALQEIGTFAYLILEKIVEPLELSSLKADLSYNFVHRLLLKARSMCQSYMEEQSIDIKDFCLCLKFECVKVIFETLELTDNSDKTSLSELQEMSEEGNFEKLKLSDINMPLAARNKIKTLIDIIIGCHELKRAFDDIEIYGGFSGVDYRFSRGVSLFFPWTFYPYIQTKTEYNDLEFIKQGRENDSSEDQPNGLKWKQLFIWHLISTGRFDDINDLVEFIEDNWIIAVNTSNKSKNTVPSAFNFEDFIFNLNRTIGLIDSKDNPLLTRGSIEYLRYFSRTRNVIPSLEVSRKF